MTLVSAASGPFAPSTGERALGRSRTFIVSPAAEGSRLDRFLVEAFVAADASPVVSDVASEPALRPSRAELQRWIEAGRVRVGARTGKASEKVRAGETIEVEPALPRPTGARPDASVRFEVLFKDDDILVVNKPAGVVMHPAAGHAEGTLVNGLLALGAFDVPDPADATGDGTSDPAYFRPGIVHRLDKGTSGVLVVARTASAREKLKVQFQAHTIAREYVALCQGVVVSGTIATMHGRSAEDRRRFTKVSRGRRAVTHVTALATLAGGKATEVCCALETGRTHQIRVHLAERGTPVLGDPLYGRPPRDARLLAVSLQIGHQALHARVLGFVHPRSGETLRFEVEPPAEFCAARAALNF